jgi:hypothetical protein
VLRSCGGIVALFISLLRSIEDFISTMLPSTPPLQNTERPPSHPGSLIYRALPQCVLLVGEHQRNPCSVLHQLHSFRCHKKLQPHLYD